MGGPAPTLPLSPKPAPQQQCMFLSSKKIIIIHKVMWAMHVLAILWWAMHVLAILCTHKHIQSSSKNQPQMIPKLKTMIQKLLQLSKVSPLLHQIISLNWAFAQCILSVRLVCLCHSQNQKHWNTFLLNLCHNHIKHNHRREGSKDWHHLVGVECAAAAAKQLSYAGGWGSLGKKIQVYGRKNRPDPGRPQQPPAAATHVTC